MKKVLIMLSSMNIGGVEKSLLSLLSTIPKEEYDITLILLEKKGGFLNSVPEWIKVEEVKWFDQVKPIIMQPPQQTIKELFYHKMYFKILLFLWAYVLSEKLLRDRSYLYQFIFRSIPVRKDVYDVAISYQGPTEVIDYFVANRVKADMKISWVHFDVSKHMINKKLFSRLYKKFNKIYVVSTEAKRKLLDEIPSVCNKAEVFMNITSTNLIRKMSREPVSFDDNYKGRKIVTVGRLSIEKGQDIAINVLLKLKKSGYKVRWYCVGEGKQRAEYEELIARYGLQDDFILLGSKVNPYPYIAKSDIYVQPSRHEGYCLTLAEAKCLNKPIITTEFTGAREQIVHGHNGYIVSHNPNKIYKKIKFLLDNPDQCNRFIRTLAQDRLNGEYEMNKEINFI